MSIDEEFLKRKIRLIEKDIKKLKKIGRIPYKEYLKNDDLSDLAERNLERIIGRMIDINYHILSQEKDFMPNDYYSSFIEMGKQGYVPLKLSESLASSAGLRNLLAHEYDEVDVKKVYQSIAIALRDVPKYLRNIMGFLNKNERKLL
jgi:uncharacterized protein YutE (UPF0331/DUF86 family)